jgi:protein-tyrosine phosphatase
LTSLNLLYVCTGNAARSVMATAMTRARAPHLDVRGAGTFSISGLPMSQRTREALKGFGLSDPDHRSQQLGTPECQWADLIVVFEPQHIGYIRKNHPEFAGISASLPRLIRHLDAGPEPLADRLVALELDSVEIEPWEEVVDPAGGDQDVFHACAAEISDLLDEFLPRLG